jgi:hypothetical protein
MVLSDGSYEVQDHIGYPGQRELRQRTGRHHGEPTTTWCLIRPFDDAGRKR